jgi:hypothetical protein
MRALIYIFSACMLLLTGCEFDNYEPPQKYLTGRLVYEGKPVGIRQGVNVLQLFQPGWQTFTPITVNVKQDGTFSSALYEGNYKLVPIQSTGPFIVSNQDTINVQVNGGQTTIDVPVQPYYQVGNESYEVNGNSLKATFNIDKIVGTATLDKVGIFIGNNVLVDNQNMLKGMANYEVSGATLGNLSQPVSLNVQVSANARSVVFARIGVKATQSAEYIFSPVQKIEL